MRERCIGVEELEANLSTCLAEVRSGTTLLLTDGGQRVARLVPEPGASESKDGPAIAWSGRRLKKTKAQGAPARWWEHDRDREGEPQVKLLYLDTSALFKRYVEEDESEEVLERIEEAPARLKTEAQCPRGAIQRFRRPDR